MIVRLDLVFLPLMHGNAANDDDPFALRDFRRRNGAGEGQEDSDQEEPFYHEFWSSTIYAHAVFCKWRGGRTRFLTPTRLGPCPKRAEARLFFTLKHSVRR